MTCGNYSDNHEVHRENANLPNRPSKTETFSLSNLVSIIGYKLTAYIGGAITTQSVWAGCKAACQPTLSRGCGPPSNWISIQVSAISIHATN